MKVNTKTWLYHKQPYQIEETEYWLAECEGIPMRTNVEELKGSLVEFTGDSREEVLTQIKQHLGVDSLQIMGVYDKDSN